MPSNSKRNRSASKTLARPPKPYDGFPLYAHPTGNWARKILGKFHYFGRWGSIKNGKMERLPGDGWSEALKVYNAQRDDLYAGREPVLSDEKEPTIKVLCNQFLTAMHARLQAGRRMSPRMFAEYRATAERLAEALGKNTQVKNLRPADFTALMARLTKFGLVRQGNEVQKIKTIFKFGVKNEIIPKEPNFGSEFKKPSKDELRLHRAKQGKRMFSADEIRWLLNGKTDSSKKKMHIAGASVQMRAMILLGINAGFGNSDCAELPLSALDLDRGWVDFPRPKNGIERRCPLWPETLEALKAAIAVRPEPKDKADQDCVFLTTFGSRWVCEKVIHPAGEETDFTKVQCIHFNSVALEFGKLLRRLGINSRKGLGFYSLRHSFRTVADGAKDQVATRLVMGHADNSIDDVYREHIEDDRLQAVVTHVHKWLFG